MIDLLIEDTGDLDFSTGDLAFVSDVAAIAQAVGTVLSVHQGEWELDTSLGVPWRTDVLLKPFDELRARAAIVGAIERVDGVVSVPSITLTLDAVTRGLSFDVVVLAQHTDGAQQPIPFTGSVDAFGQVSTLSLPTVPTPGVA